MHGSPSSFGPEQVSLFLKNNQCLYSHACEAFELQPHQIKISCFVFPKGVWKFVGIGDAALAVKYTLLAAPDFVAGMAVRAQRSNLSGCRVMGENLDILKPILKDLFKIMDINLKRQRYIEYTLSQALGLQAKLRSWIKVEHG